MNDYSKWDSENCDILEGIKTFDGLIYWLQVLRNDEDTPEHIVDPLVAAINRLTNMRKWANDDSEKLEKLQPFYNSIMAVVKNEAAQ